MPVALPAANVYANAATVAVKKQWGEDIRSYLAQSAGQTEEALVVAAGVVSPTKHAITVDTEGAAATDDLNTATQNLPEGSYLEIRNLDNSKVTTIKHAAGGAGQFLLADEVDFELADVDEVIIFKRVGTSWEERWRSTGNRLLRVLEVTEVAASPKVLVASDNEKYLKGDAAAAATNYATLPAAAIGMRFPFGTDSAQKLRLTAAGANTIQRAGTTSGAGGFYETAAEDGFQGEIICWKSGQWIVRESNTNAGAGAVT